MSSFCIVFRHMYSNKLMMHIYILCNCHALNHDYEHQLCIVSRVTSLTHIHCVIMQQCQVVPRDTCKLNVICMTFGNLYRFKSSTTLQYDRGVPAYYVAKTFFTNSFSKQFWRYQHKQPFLKYLLPYTHTHANSKHSFASIFYNINQVESKMFLSAWSFQ